jgi:hypothetical protein
VIERSDKYHMWRLDLFIHWAPLVLLEGGSMSNKYDDHDHDGDPLPEGVAEAPPRFGGGYLYRVRELLVPNDRLQDLDEVLGVLGIRLEGAAMEVPGLPLTLLLLSPDEPRTVPEVVWQVRAFEEEVEEEAEHRDFSRLVFPVTVVRGAPHPKGHAAAPPRPTDPLCDLCEEGNLPGTNVRVAVLDSGVVEGHPWLDAHQIDRRQADVEVPEFDGLGRLAPFSGHGTFVTGDVLQHAPGATVVARKVFGGDGFTSDVELAAALLARPEVEVVNLSLGGPTHDDIGLPATEAALQVLFAKELVPVVVAAAGNGYGDRPFYPAAFKRVIAVGGLDGPEQRACFSNRGSWVDACAPAVGLRSTFLTVDARTPPPTPPNCLGFAHNPGAVFEFQGWAKWSGTSFSTAVVAGSIAATIRPGTDPSEAAFRLVGAAGLPRLLGQGLGAVVDSVRYG